MMMRTIRGVFYRAIDPEFREFALGGSRSAGRYSRPDEPTLYLSSSVAGVNAAMIAHKGVRSPLLEILEVDVEASHIVDLRDPAALERVGIDLSDALAPWQTVASSGGIPASWMVADAD